MSALQASGALPVLYPGLRASALALGYLLYPFRAYAGSNKFVVVGGSFDSKDSLTNDGARCCVITLRLKTASHLLCQPRVSASITLGGIVVASGSAVSAMSANDTSLIPTS
jgi:hypothetical protein